MVDTHPRIATHFALTKRSPMIFFDDVSHTSGTIEIGNAMHRNTCDPTRSSSRATSEPLNAIVQTNTGITVMTRVMTRRAHSGMRSLMKPSITIWPVSVPVIVEFWPEASSATAKSVDRTGLATVPASEGFWSAS